MEQKRIITISREFGSGGRTIAKAVAERLGLAYYDKELIKQVADRTGFDPTYIEENGEAKGRWAFLERMGATPGVMGGLTTADFLWVMQRQVITDLADKAANENQPCLIVGRCADYILKDRPDALHVFIHAAPEWRAERIVRLYGESAEKPLERLNTKDARRRNNYNHYTDRTWGACQNYTLSLDSGELGIDRCVDLICTLYTQSAE